MSTDPSLPNNSSRKKSSESDGLEGIERSFRKFFNKGYISQRRTILCLSQQQNCRSKYTHSWKNFFFSFGAAPGLFSSHSSNIFLSTGYKKRSGIPKIYQSTDDYISCPQKNLPNCNPIYYQSTRPSFFTGKCLATSRRNDLFSSTPLGRL